VRYQTEALDPEGEVWQLSRVWGVEAEKVQVRKREYRTVDIDDDVFFLPREFCVSVCDNSRASQAAMRGSMASGTI
jgi:hypothetical protein